ncbi:MAG: RNA polymerase sigma factor [Planctomycetes bacterium]|nr:RNA polymerase sigma factor [Planctomycetota bacterium]
MAHPHAPEARVNAPASSSTLADDEALYARFAASRDAEVFAELVRRHQAFAYRVAYCICAQAQLAEEAAQEAFVQIARPDVAFRSQGAGSFRAWFYRLVVQVARSQLRNERRNMNRAKSRRYLDEVQAVAAARAAGEIPTAADPESLDAVRSALCALKEDLRAPIVMHYIQGLSQVDVARTIGVSAAQVSRRIAKGLEALKRRLAENGASLSVIALPGLLQNEALLPSPPTLAAKLGNLNLKSLGAKAAKQSLRVAAGKGALAYVVPAVLALSAAAGGVWYLLAPPVPEKPAASKDIAAPVAPRFKMTWDLAKEPPKDLKIMQGTGYWQPPQGDRPGSWVFPPRTDRDPILLLPVPAPEEGPFMLEVICEPVEWTRWAMGAGWATESYYVGPKQFWKSHKDIKLGTVLVFRAFFYDRYVVSDFADQPNVPINVVEYDRWRAGHLLYIAPTNCGIHKINLRSIEKEELPEMANDIPALVASLEPNGSRADKPFAGPDGPDAAFMDGFKRSVDYHKSWTFENGIPEDFEFFQTRSEWLPATEKFRARIVKQARPGSVIAIKGGVPVAPMRVRFTAIMQPKDPGIDAVWMHDAASPPLVTWFKRLPCDVNQRCVFDVYLVGAYIFKFRDGELNAIVKFSRPWPASNLRFASRDTAIESIEITGMKSVEELPALIRDPEKAIREFGGTQAEHSSSTINPVTEPTAP